MASRAYMRLWYHDKGGREWLRQWRKQNKHRLSEQAKLRHSKNPSRRKRSFKKWRDRHLNEERSRFQKWYCENRKKLCARKKQSYHANPEKFRKRSREFYHKSLKNDPAYQIKNRARAKAHSRIHPERNREATQRRRARIVKASIGDGKIIRRFMALVKSLRVIKCYYCGGRITWKRCQFDHIKPLCKGGSHSIDNLCVACSACNSLKGRKDLTEWALVSPVLCL